MDNTTVNTKRRYDAVVVGGGNGGLAAAAQLAAKGTRVLLLERHNLPGGFGSSFVRGRFEFETALHILCDYGPAEQAGSVRNFLVDELGVDIGMVAVPDAYRFLITEDGIDTVMPLGVEEFIAAMEREVPGSRGPMTRYLELCREVLEALIYLGETKGNPDKRVLRTKYANFLKTAAYSVKEVTDRFGIPEKALKLLYTYWLNIGPPVSRLNFTLWAGFMYKYLTMGGYIPRHRSHELMTALDARIRELGGETEYNTRVDRILVSGGRVTGVVTEYGEEIETRHVICNASPTLAYSSLVYPKEEVPKAALRNINARKYGVSVFVVYLGLDATADELGLATYGYVVSPYLDTERLYESFSRPEAPIIQATVCLNRAVPDCSPPGTCIVTLTGLMRPEAWGDVKPEEYFAAKTKMADAMIDQFEKATRIDLRSHIEEIEVAAPGTYARYTGTYDGIIYGYEPESWDSIIPRIASIQDEKYIDGLYFAGGFSFRALGYSSALMSGQMTANLTLREMEAER
ncbi:MAG: NAD(P)/FAD-dependent oxidoreductase [Spirochaetes bacterium]|nr:NAD(P)/FAD-dependent oxidoreductase [Spirochaetota bacterium]